MTLPPKQAESNEYFPRLAVLDMKSMRKHTVGDVRRLAQRHTSNLYDTYFTRRVSAWITTALAPFGVSPNLVSLINFNVGIFGCALIGFGRDTTLALAGILLIHLYAILDSVDGELARLLNLRSLRGMFLEDWSAYAMMTAFPLAVALYLQSAGASSAAVVLAVLFAVLGRNVMPALRRAIAQSGEVPRQRDPNSPEPVGRTAGWKAVVEDHLLHQTNIRLVLTSLILVHVAFRKITPLEIAFYAYIGALLIREAGILFLALRGDLVERELQRLRGEADRPRGSAPHVLP